MADIEKLNNISRFEGHLAAESVFASEGPYREIRAGENVKIDDIVNGMVPERTYGGRRRKGPLPEGVSFDRRQSQNPVRKP